MKAVSVIIPIYNVEKYLEECLASAINQTLKNIEIICVNDGTPDSSMDIVEKYQKDDERIVVVNKENGGLSSARNAGMKVATGEYIYFLDSDDLLQEDALEKLYLRAVAENLDVLYFDGGSFCEDDSLSEHMKRFSTYYIRKHDYSGVVSGKELLVEMRKNMEYRAPAWLNLTKRSHIEKHKLSFHEGVLFEDEAYTFACMIKADRVSHTPEHFYRRRVRPNSVMTGNTKFEHAYGYFVAFWDMFKILQEMQLSEEEEEVAATIVGRVLDGARNRYHEIDLEEERQQYTKLMGSEKAYFETLVVKYDRIWRNKEKKCDDYKRLEVWNEQCLQNIENLKEKNKKLHEELAAVRASFTYRLGQAIVRPFRKIKKIISKKNG